MVFVEMVPLKLSHPQSSFQVGPDWMQQIDKLASIVLQEID